MQAALPTSSGSGSPEPASAPGTVRLGRIGILFDELLGAVDGMGIGLGGEPAAVVVEDPVCGEGCPRSASGSSEATAGAEFQAAVSVSWLCRKA
jgi:hypothetical protein